MEPILQTLAALTMVNTGDGVVLSRGKISKDICVLGVVRFYNAGVVPRNMC
jgi:hypothetical protein